MKQNLTTLLIPFTYDIAVGLNSKCKFDVIYFKFADAFDSVSHDPTIKKLKEAFGIDKLMLRFIK